MVYFEEINKQLLNTLSSSTLSGMSDFEIDETLALLMFRAIADFRFPQIALTYNKEVNSNLGTQKYYFTNDITQKEINVLLALMKKYWLEQQLDSERNFEMLYYDKDVRTFSRGILCSNLRRDTKTQNLQLSRRNLIMVELTLCWGQQQWGQ